MWLLAYTRVRARQRRDWQGQSRWVQYRAHEGRSRENERAYKEGQGTQRQGQDRWERYQSDTTVVVLGLIYHPTFPKVHFQWGFDVKGYRAGLWARGLESLYSIFKKRPGRRSIRTLSKPLWLAKRKSKDQIGRFVDNMYKFITNFLV